MAIRNESSGTKAQLGIQGLTPTPVQGTVVETFNLNVLQFPRVSNRYNTNAICLIHEDYNRNHAKPSEWFLEFTIT